MSNTTITTLPGLAEIDKALTAHFKTITAKMESFEDTILADRLKIGLQALKAHQLFSHNPGKGGRPKKPSTVDGISPIGFEGWLTETHTWLKKPTAYRWMTALKGLGLDENSDEEDIEPNLEARRKLEPVTIKSLCAAAVDIIGPPPTPPVLPNLQQAEFQFLRESLTAYRIQSEGILAIKDQLKGMPEMHKAACARAYATLSELTGTQWTPSDEPDDLANVNPDSIDL